MGICAQARTATILSIQERQRDDEARKGVRGCDRRTGRRPTDSGADVMMDLRLAPARRRE